MDFLELDSAFEEAADPNSGRDSVTLQRSSQPREHLHSRRRVEQEQSITRQVPWRFFSACSHQAVTFGASRRSEATFIVSGIDSCGKWPYVSSISSMLIPSARHERINDTENRVPRIASFPPSNSGSATIQRYSLKGFSSCCTMRPSSTISEYPVGFLRARIIATRLVQSLQPDHQGIPHRNTVYSQMPTAEMALAT